MNLHGKIDYSISLIKKAEKLALDYCEDGFSLAFSGGKDSQVIHELAVMADVKFKAHMNLTSVDPPQVIRFVRKNYPDVELHRPKESIYKLIVKKKLLPTRINRWCCAVLKEQSGAGTVTIVGVRREESIRRRNRNEVEIWGRKFSGNFDQFSEHRETEVSCVSGKDKIVLNPILQWTEKDVWAFLSLRGLPHCELYDMGYKRIGCIMCPMASKSSAHRDRKMFPKVERAYKKAIERLIKEVPEYGSAFGKHRSADVIFDWWVSKKSIRKYISDEFDQLKINFKK
ncbi:MAG: phosphoadenosine phosphosulfate reductase family protein [Prevotella sp.]|jgi:phosphoadenosine phosphosulfate reductase|nr:phosphoadenosine phosphosulfate reductase family protein [Prevotella sp.]